MDLATIEITPEEATDRLKEIPSASRDERTIEDESLAMAYCAAKRIPGDQHEPGVYRGREFPRAGAGLFVPPVPTVCSPAAAAPMSARNNKVRYQFTDPDLRSNLRGTLVGRGHVNVSVDDTRLDNRREEVPSGTTIVLLIPAKVRPKLSRLRRPHPVGGREVGPDTAGRPRAVRHTSR